MFDIDLLIGFLPGLVYGLAVFPIGFAAQEKRLDPVEGHIFEILTEMQILFSGQMSVSES
jgi:hypothetical protein